MKYDVAIIGGGAAAVSYLCSLVKLATKKGTKISVLVFDKHECVGRGQVFRQDYPWLIMNTPARDLSAVYGEKDDFIHWSARQGTRVNEGDYVSREKFGHYLKSRFDDILTQAVEVIDVRVVPCKVDDVVERKGCFILVTEKKQKFQARFAVVAARHHSYSDPYHLIGVSGFVNNPYPLVNALSRVEKNRRVLIMGSGLTAVDCAISLGYEKNPSCMVMVSRKGFLPEVKGNKLFTTRPRFFLAQEILKNEKITLGLLLRYARKEFNRHGIDWRSYLFKKREICDSIRYFVKQITKAQNQPTEYNIMLGMIFELANIWPRLSKKDLQLFLDNHYSFIQQKHGAMPLQNATIIYSLLSDGCLQLKKGIAQIVKNNGEFVVDFTDSSQACFDYVINATGPQRKILHTHDNTLYINLLNKKMIEELSCGGIRVHFPDALPVVKEKIANDNLFFIGHNAEGTHIFTNNYQWIVETGYLSAEKLMAKI